MDDELDALAGANATLALTGMLYLDWRGVPGGCVGWDWRLGWRSNSSWGEGRGDFAWGRTVESFECFVPVSQVFFDVFWVSYSGF